ncbi:unnamed protein product [Caenorhabditis brenneri]
MIKTVRIITFLQKLAESGENGEETLLVKITQLKEEALAEFMENKRLGSSATTEIEKADELLDDSDDEKGDEESTAEENASWKKFVLNSYNATEEEEEAKFQAIMDVLSWN